MLSSISLVCLLRSRIEKQGHVMVAGQYGKSEDRPTSLPPALSTPSLAPILSTLAVFKAPQTKPTDPHRPSRGPSRCLEGLLLVRWLLTPSENFQRRQHEQWRSGLRVGGEALLGSRRRARNRRRRSARARSAARGDWDRSRTAGQTRAQGWMRKPSRLLKGSDPT
jgi:hypothetical protein